MDQFSGIRAKTRRKRDRDQDRAPARPIGVGLLLVLALFVAAGPAAASGGGHDAAPPPPPAAPAEPPPPVEKPRPPPPPPPVLNGPIAAPAPIPRVHWLADAFTGLALGGYDPVAYFLEGKPVLGRPENELDWGGTTWRFTGPGNLAAFRDSPEVYAPRFAGYCVFAVSQGRPTEGSPLVPLLWHGRLLLFADPLSRVAFLADPDRLIAEAEGRWPALAAELP
ncbi:hypothetical protein EYW49_11460 [Siculibacillus lacustris]|uniref:YHS domain-containing protein n=1 Tax=Siculibacillus lacustris TaxID=1549641 RepID=A0A4Q9VNU5_9HYPH|nr:YHS domain-containing (seleno)protein [Siculibacillus lacustris]TBW37373.1 hypothetical protein EYW49_11460 [Siculibacillus lacustris]